MAYIFAIQHPEKTGLRQWGGNLPSGPPKTRRGLAVIETSMPHPTYPIPAMARELIEALHAAEETWELRVYEHEDQVLVRQWHPHQWPVHTDWKWSSGRRTHGTAVRDTLAALQGRRGRQLVGH